MTSGAAFGALSDVGNPNVGVGGELCQRGDRQPHSGSVVRVDGVLDDVFELPRASLFRAFDHLLALISRCRGCARGLALLNSLSVPVDAGAGHQEHRLGRPVLPNGVFTFPRVLRDDGLVRVRLQARGALAANNHSVRMARRTCRANDGGVDRVDLSVVVFAIIPESFVAAEGQTDTEMP